MTHDERLALIYRPFTITYFGRSYPWGGVAVTDNFFGTHEYAERPNKDWSKTVFGGLLRTGPEGGLELMSWAERPKKRRHFEEIDADNALARDFAPGRKAAA